MDSKIIRRSEDDSASSVTSKPFLDIHREDNNIFFNSELNTYSIYTLEKHLRDIYKTSRIKTVNIIIDSYGGHPCSIYDFLKSYPLETVGYVNGYCCSGATTILLGCTKRYMSPSSLMLIHSHQGQMDEWIKLGSIEDEYKNISKQNEVVLRRIYKKETRIPSKELDNLLRDRERYLTADECKRWKIIDGICTFTGVE